MVQSSAETVEEYLDELPEERRQVVAAVRELVREQVPEGYREGMRWGMITWELPLERYPDTYNGQPLSYVGLAAQKRHYALYLHGVYMDETLQERLREGYEVAGEELDMGKSCLRFRSLDDLVPEAVGDVVSALPPEAFIERYEEARRR